MFIAGKNMLNYKMRRFLYYILAGPKEDKNEAASWTTGCRESLFHQLGDCQFTATAPPIFLLSRVWCKPDKTQGTIQRSYDLHRLLLFLRTQKDVVFQPFLSPLHPSQQLTIIFNDAEWNTVYFNETLHAAL
jgi:hypothetical protein